MLPLSHKQRETEHDENSAGKSLHGFSHSGAYSLVAMTFIVQIPSFGAMTVDL